MAALTLGGPQGYAGGAETSSKYVGYLDSKNYVLRYTFTTPPTGYITSLSFSTTFRHNTGDAGTTFYVRAKITESATSHINAGASTTDYDAQMSMSGTANAGKSCTISGLWLEPGKTYYLFLFPGTTSVFRKYCYNNSGADYGVLSYDSVVASYTLSISAGTGSTITVNRTSSPSGSTGALSSGAAIYYGDVLQITFAASSGYEIKTQTVNGSAFPSGGSHMVTAAVAVVTTTGLMGLVYIDTGSGLEKFLIYIDNGTAWEQYVPYVDNGTGWDMCS